MNFRSRNKIKVEAGMSSMTDLVFLLLIFFIIMSTLASPQFGVDLPDSNGVSEPLKDGTIDVIVNKENEIRVETDEGRPMDFKEVEARIIKAKEELLAAGMQEPRLKIHADRESKFEKFSDLVAIAKLHDLKLVIAAK